MRQDQVCIILDMTPTLGIRVLDGVALMMSESGLANGNGKGRKAAWRRREGTDWDTDTDTDTLPSCVQMHAWQLIDH